MLSMRALDKSQPVTRGQVAVPHHPTWSSVASPIITSETFDVSSAGEMVDARGRLRQPTSFAALMYPADAE